MYTRKELLPQTPIDGKPGQQQDPVAWLGRKGGRKEGREGGREGGKEGGREGCVNNSNRSECVCIQQAGREGGKKGRRDG